MSQHTYTTSIELSINCNSCEVEAEVFYEYEPAGGDGWNEPRYPENVTLCTVEVKAAHGAVDLLPLLSPECVSQLEADLLQHEAEEREVRASEYAEWKRETTWEVL